MFEREKGNLKAFDVEAESSDESNKKDEGETGFWQKKNLRLVIILALALIGGIVLYKILHKIQEKDLVASNTPKQVMFVPLDEMTINLRSGLESNATWLRVKVTLEVRGKENYDAVSQLSPKVMDILQTYLKELRRGDLDGSFGIYKMKDEILTRLNTVLYPARIEDVLFQEIIMQTMQN